MPPERTNKIAAAPKIQGKLNFQRVQMPRTTVSPLVQILSQYELMIMVTDQLSSADIIHLTATCKEIKTYLTDGETIYASITERANCDGKGIEARAKCFGHWKGDLTKATVRCGGSDCQPCDGCSAMVCNVSASEFFLTRASTHIRQECRYHITYMNDSPCCRDDPLHWESHEADCAMDLELVHRCHGHCGDCMSGYINELACDGCADSNVGSGPEFHSGNFPIESIRAASLAGEPRERRHCSECMPNFGKNKKFNYETIHNFVFEIDFVGDWCCCTLAYHFIEDSWLCLPCFFEQEAQAYSRCLKRGAYKKEHGDDGSTRKLTKTVSGFLTFSLYCC